MHVDPTTPITLRPAQASDAARLAELFIQLGYDTPLSHLQQQLDCAGAEVTVAMDQGELVGVLVMHLLAPLHVARPWAVISALVVDITGRSQGAGAALVAHALHSAQARQCAHIELACSEQRAAAHRFYLAQGFQEVRKRFVKRF